MIMKYLAIIPARGGSKRIKNKNIKLLNDKPLIYYTINSALNSRLKKYGIYVSTDSRRIAEISKDLGAQVPFLRAKKHAKDKSSSYGLVKEYIDYFTNLGATSENIILLQPTSPLRSSGDIDSAIKKFEKLKSKSLISITEAKENPYYLFKKRGNTLTPFLNKKYQFKRSQDLKSIFKINGAIYIIRTDIFLKERKIFINNTAFYEMPWNRSIDIDEQSDWDLVEILMKKGKVK